jgi:hypothetical protein
MTWSEQKNNVLCDPSGKYVQCGEIIIRGWTSERFTELPFRKGKQIR